MHQRLGAVHGEALQLVLVPAGLPFRVEQQPKPLQDSFRRNHHESTDQFLSKGLTPGGKNKQNTGGGRRQNKPVQKSVLGSTGSGTLSAPRLLFGH